MGTQCHSNSIANDGWVFILPADLILSVPRHNGMGKMRQLPEVNGKISAEKLFDEDKDLMCWDGKIILKNWVKGCCTMQIR
jgi:hypothetical protein